MSTLRALADVADERRIQDAKWGVQNLPDGTSKEEWSAVANAARTLCNMAASEDAVTWKDILMEEFFEAMAESDPKKLREELVQVAAVAVQWIEAIDRRVQP